MTYFFDGFLLLFGPCMDVPVGCCLDIRITDDGLNGLDIRSGIVQQSRKAVPEHMRRSAMQIYRAVDPLHHAAMDTKCDWIDISNDIAEATQRPQEGVQRLYNGDVAHTALCFRRADFRGIAAAWISDVPFNMNHIPLNIQITPTQPQYLSPAHTGEQKERHIPSVPFFQAMK